MLQDLSIVYGQGDAEQFYRLLDELRSANYLPMPNCGGGIYFGRVEPPPSFGGYRLAWMASALAQPECRVEDLEVAGWIVEVSADGIPWQQYHTRKIYENREVAMHSVDQMRRHAPAAHTYRAAPVYRMGQVSARHYNIYKVLGGSLGEGEKTNEHE